MSASSVGHLSGTSPLFDLQSSPTTVTDALHATQVKNALSANFDTSSVRERYDHYAKLFGDALTVGRNEKIQRNLKNRLNAILSLISPGKSYDFPLDIVRIFEENALPAENICKNGNAAYKFYLKKILTELNNFHDILTQAKQDLANLKTLLDGETDENSLNEPWTRLDIYEEQSEGIVRQFSEYKIPKNLAIQYVDWYVYNDVQKKVQTAFSAASNAKGVERYDKPESAYIDLSGGTLPSRISDNVSSIEDLRKIQTEKYTYNRKVTTAYCQKGTYILTDRYDTSADTYVITEDDIEDRKRSGLPYEEKSDISFFDELPLLDKLKYIALYYTKPGTRRIFPDDDINGFPCLPNPVPTGIDPTTGQDKKYTSDIIEIGQLEPFFIGYLVDRDGPVNALSAFMEIKSAAISDQIKILGYRVKALRYYLHLLNRGLAELNKSQSDRDRRIPNISYAILSMIASNPTRTLKKVTVNGVTNDYIVLQWTNDEGKKDVHTTQTNRYLLVKADEAGIETFNKYANNFADYIPGYLYLKLCDNTVKADAYASTLYNTGFVSEEDYNDLAAFTSDAYDVEYEKGDSVDTSLFRLRKYIHYFKNNRSRGMWRDENCGDNMFILEEPDESKLPRELGTVRMNITGALRKWDDNLSWNNYHDGKYTDKVWPAVVKVWKTTYDTAVNNVQTQLESVNKSIESLRTKVNTFDSSSSNWRNKAYAVYNKTVNNIE